MSFQFSSIKNVDNNERLKAIFDNLNVNYESTKVISYIIN